MDTLGVAAGMIGIIGLFVIFRFQSLDAYVDHRKDILRNLLNTEVKADPRLAVAIQRVGKGPFAGIYSTRLSEAKNVAVDQFCEDILSLRQRRAKTVGGGMGTMALWLIWAFMGLPILESRVPQALSWVTVGSAMLGTIWFVYWSSRGSKEDAWSPRSLEKSLIKRQYRLYSFKDRRTILSANSPQSALYRLRYQEAFQLVHALVPHPDSLILDAGCGDGTLLPMLTPHYRHVVGLDLSERSLQWIRHHHWTARQSVVLGDVESLPFKDESVAAIVCVETLEHLEELAPSLLEFARILGPNGVLVATVPSITNRRNLTIAISQAGGRSFWRASLGVLAGFWNGQLIHEWSDDARRHVYPHRLFAKRTIVRAVTQAGLRVLQLEKTPWIGATRFFKGRFLGELWVLAAKRADAS